MAWYVWVIIALVALSYFQFYAPDKANDILDPAYGKLNEYTDKIPFIGGAECSEEYNPVCGNNVTYDNPCLAGVDGITQVTIGVCQ